MKLGWFNNLVETYERISRIPEIIGVADRNGNVLLPQNHMMKDTQICIILDGEGGFRRAEESDLYIMIQCTEKSENARTSAAIVPHPLHEELKYLACKKKNMAAYQKLISVWLESTKGAEENFSLAYKKIKAVHDYIIGGTILNDLQKTGIETYVNEFDKTGQKKAAKTIQSAREKIEKLFVRFRVEIPNDLKPNLWEDMNVAILWQKCYKGLQDNDKAYRENISLCYITGEIAPIRRLHPIGINKFTMRAKLISSNDDKFYTFRGRFIEAQQANSISVKASHEAHAMLKYLIATQGLHCDTQAVVAWAIDDGATQLNMFASGEDIFGLYEYTTIDKRIKSQYELAANYAKNLRNALKSKGTADLLKDMSRRVAILAVDIAISSRMGITFYQELRQNEYLDKVIKWHETCCWWFRYKGYDHDSVSAPSANSIIAAVFGKYKGEGYKKIQKQARERILSFIFNGEVFDKAWLNAAVNRVSNPFSFSYTDGGWNYYEWASTINVTCAIMRKFYSDKKEVISLELDKTCDDRNYLYGRLLAIAEKIESLEKFLRLGKSATDNRTNAVNYMTAFANKPFRTWPMIYTSLIPYMQRLKNADKYQQKIDNILFMFKEGDYKSDKPLNGLYLLGYSLQRRALKNENDRNNKKNKDKSTNNVKDKNDEGDIKDAEQKN